MSLKDFEKWWKNYKISASKLTLQDMSNLPKQIAYDAWMASEIIESKKSHKTNSLKDEE
jgi:hypothetical protein